LKLGLIADTHDNIPNIRKAIKIFNETGIRLIAHAGDFIAPFSAKEFKAFKGKIIAVFGNCDGEKKGLKEAFKGIGEIYEEGFSFRAGRRHIFLTHVPDNLESDSMIKEYDLLIFGHTHKAEVKKIGGSVIVNPGEAGGWLYGKATIAIADLESLSVKIISL